MNNLLSEKCIIVTGAGGGIGKQVASDLLKLNVSVIATDLNIELLRNYLTTREFNSSKLLIMKHDVRQEKDWLSILNEISEKNWNLFGLINCAAVLNPGYIKNVSIKDIDYHVDINIKGTILGSTIVTQYLKKNDKPGHIVNIASLAGVAPIPGISLYSASKFAVRGFSIALGYELKNDNITVTVICPDAVNTNMLDLQIPFEEASLTFSGTTLEPEDISQLIIKSFKSKKIEILVPTYRGILAKIGNLFPELASLLITPLKKIGNSRQKNLR